MKEDGHERRALGITTFEDKVLQTAVTMALGPIFEQDFLPCSYGFRPQRSAHQALETVREDLRLMGGGYVIDLDIKDFFNAVDHTLLRVLFRKRVCDGVLCRLLGKWLKAGIVEDGIRSFPQTGVPQGGVISPLLSNLVLHEVLDSWFESGVKPRMRGKASIVRYADDAQLMFERKDDAMKIFEILPKRFAKYGLTLHPKKTRVVDFRRQSDGEQFTFLGFLHMWGKSQKGRLVIKKKTAPKRLGVQSEP